MCSNVRLFYLAGMALLAAACGSRTSLLSEAMLADAVHDGAAVVGQDPAPEMQHDLVADAAPVTGSGIVRNPSLLGSRLVLWLVASVGLESVPGSSVSLWTDQSGYGNDAKQPVTASRPTFTTDAINGRPGVTFDGVATFLSIADAASLRWGTKDFTVLVVARCSNAASELDAMLYQKSPDPSPWPGPALYLNSSKPSPTTRVGAQLDLFTFALTDRGYNDDTPHLFGARRVGTTLEVRIDGSPSGSKALSTAIDISAAGRAAIIGHNGYRPLPSFQALRGSISEVVAVEDAISVEELGQVENYLLAQYGLARP